MKTQNIVDKKKLFWVLNISGWWIMVAVIIFIYVRDFSAQSDLIIHYLSRYSIGFFICLLLVYFFRKFDFKSLSIQSILLKTIPFLILSVHLWIVFELLKDIFVIGNLEFQNPFTFSRYLHDFLYNSLYLFCWTTFYFGIKFWIEWSEQKVRSEQAEILAKNAQLRMLRYQLNPHFLFNSLNSVRALVDEDEERAQKMTTELIEFLRYSLTQKNYDNIPLKDELNSLKHYFAIEKQRYEDKLDVSFNVEPRAENYPVLSFLIHPLVENAVKHGMQTSQMPLKIMIKADVTDDKLKLTVSNSGKWLKPDEKNQEKYGTGTGLDNVRLRLHNSFPGRHKLNISEETGIVSVSIEIQGNFEGKYAENI
ncbi:sensor histidine kinase [candidate division KSB1 bacterium]